MNETRIVSLECQHCKEMNPRPLPYDLVPNDICDHCGRIMTPIPMILTCPSCGKRHIDEAPFDTKHHHTHACQGCGIVWRPAIEFTVGVQFLPGYKNGDPPPRPSRRPTRGSAIEDLEQAGECLIT